MKIVQIITGMEGDAGNTEHTIYGLGDDGVLYYLERHHSPSAHSAGRRTYDKETIRKWMTEEKPVNFSDGCTTGWVPLCGSDERSKTLPHELDPTRAERG